MSEFKVSPSRKLVDSSFIWRRLDGSYSCLGGVNLIDGLVYYCQQKGIVSETLGQSASKDIEQYFKKRGIEPNNNIVEDYVKQFSDKLTGSMFIESRSKDEAIKHRLRVSDVVSRYSSDGMKNASFRSMNLLCNCPGAHYQIYLTVSPEIRKSYDDNRKTYDIPSPQIVMPIDAHGVTGMNWLVEERKAEGFGIFGLTNHTIEIAKHTIKSVLDENTREYELNIFLRDRTDLFNPLEKILKASLT